MPWTFVHLIYSGKLMIRIPADEGNKRCSGATVMLLFLFLLYCIYLAFKIKNVNVSSKINRTLVESM